MSPERLQKVEELYHLVREGPLEARTELLAQADLELRREVESLLGQHGGEGVLDRPAMEVAAKLLEDTSIERLTVGASLGPYRIESSIGAGGMGQVYKARDTRLGRAVAIKVSSREFNARFEREARAISALNHPHICTLHDIGPNYLVMELVEGSTLAERLKQGALPMELMLRYGAQIADALADAHAQSIIHRDLKPGNIMIAKAGVKVLDFGLAKSPQDESLTGRHSVMGTPAYMAPEQREGKACDARVDIYALGLVLYEMATGKRPLHDQPAFPDNLPEGLAHVIQRCLEMDPEQRWQTASDIRAELDWVARPKTPAPALTPLVVAEANSAARAEEGFWVAVLPFKYSGTDGQLATLAEGITADVVAGLSRFSYLRVISISSISRYAHESVDAIFAGKQLGARYVMEGVLRQAGATLRIAAQLVDATSGVHLWAESYERTFRPDAVFEIPDDVAPRIVSTVGDGRGVLPRSISEALRNKDPHQLSPYEAVLRSFAHFQRVSAEEHAPSREALEHATQLAPGHADCWAMLSLLYKEEYTHGFNVRPDPLGRAFAAAQRAIEAAPSNYLAYHALASVLYFQKEFQAFRGATERAIALNPTDGFTIAYLGFLTAYSGDWERGCALVQRARSLNPHHPGWYWFADLFDAYRKCDYRRAVQIGLKINMPSFWRTSVALAAAYGQIGEVEASRNALQTLLTLQPDFALMAREELAKWWDPELVEHLIDGLRKAGLEIPSETGTPRAKPVGETGS